MTKKILRLCLLGLVAVLLLTTLIHSEGVLASDPLPDQQVLIVRYENRDQLADLADRYDVVEVDPETQTARIFSNQVTRDALASEGLTWTIDYPYTARINEELKPLTGQITGIPGYPCYRTVAEIYAAADTLAATYPDLVQLLDIGDSWEKTQNATQGWDMEVLLLTNRNNPTVQKSDAFFMSGIHAREWAPPELNLRLAEYLLANYATNADVKWLLDYNRIHLVLSTNPDGRVQDEANTSILWRKNTNNNYCGGSVDRGADLNRNYPYQWQLIPGQCGETYSGPSAGSEPETVAILNYVDSIFPDQKGPNPNDPVNELNATGMFIDLHSYSRLVLWPWGYTYSTAPNDASLRVMSYKFAYYNGHDPVKSTELYPTTGSTDDWAYGELGVPGFCFEVGDDFHQNCTVFNNDINPNNQKALLRAIKIARLPYRLTYGPEVTSLSASPNPSGPGQNLVVYYTANDTLYSSYGTGVPSQNIISVKYSIDKPSWIAGSGWQIVPINAGSPIYSGSISISTAGLTLGQHTIFLESADGSGLWGPPTAIFFTISDGEPPVAAADTYTTDEDVELVVTAAEGVLANDTDDYPITAVKETDAANGTLALAADGSFTYLPDANFFGEDSFTYRAFDGALYSDLVSVAITIYPINDAPVALADVYTTDEDVELAVAVPGVLANDTDIEGDGLTAVIESDVANGTLALAADGSFTYLPDANFFGEDSFTYRAFDGALYSEVVTVTITVNPINDTPVAVADSYMADEDVELVVGVAEGVLTNDADDGPMTAALQTDVANGTLALTADGSLTYMPDADFFGEDSFTYKAFDGALYSNAVTVTITVSPINDAPVAVADAYSTDQNTELSVAAPGVLTNDTDVEKDVLTAVLETDVANGTLVLAADGSFTYLPDAGFFGEDVFTYKAFDGVLSSGAATVTITVNEVVPEVFYFFVPLIVK